MLTAIWQVSFLVRRNIYEGTNSSFERVKEKCCGNRILETEGRKVSHAKDLAGDPEPNHSGLLTAMFLFAVFLAFALLPVFPVP